MNPYHVLRDCCNVIYRGCSSGFSIRDCAYANENKQVLLHGSWSVRKNDKNCVVGLTGIQPVPREFSTNSVTKCGY